MAVPEETGLLVMCVYKNTLGFSVFMLCTDMFGLAWNELFSFTTTYLNYMQ